MASTFESIERIRPGGAQASPAGIGSFILDRDQRSFHIAGNSPSEALARLPIDFPNYAQHPSSSLVFAGLSVGERIGGGDSPAYEITVTYGPPGFSLTGGGPPVDRSNPFFHAFATSIAPMTLEAPLVSPRPVYVEVPLAGPIAPGQPFPTQTVIGGVEFDIKYLTINVPSIRASIEVNVPASGYGVNEQAIVFGQYSKIHTFGGRKWQFQGLQQEFGGHRADQHKLIYSWVSEPGVPEETFEEYNSRQDQFGNGGYKIPPLAPFERWTLEHYIEENLSPFYAPEIIAVLPQYVRPYIVSVAGFVEDPDGYANFPGNPIR